MRRGILAVLLFALAGLGAVNAQEDAPSRAFFMGVTPFPYAITLGAVNDV
ncbi:MAG: hypothetical protein JNL42_17530 [Anaerolineae bacterium]|nr:hypothetical protein [Anaerolineae bacterium]